MLRILPAGFGLEQGDAILSINGEDLISIEQLMDAIKGSSEGSAVEFQIRLAGSGEIAAYSVAR